MDLLILAIIAFVIGYLLAGSKFSKPIDDASGKVAETSKNWTGKAESWWRGLFEKDRPAKPPIVDASETTAPEQIQAAEKLPSRRIGEDKPEE